MLREKREREKRGKTVDIKKACLTSDIDNRENKENPYEICVCCNKQLKITRNQEIAFRTFYIEGAGQLCYDCYQELYRGNYIQTV